MKAIFVTRNDITTIRRITQIIPGRNNLGVQKDGTPSVLEIQGMFNGVSVSGRNYEEGVLGVCEKKGSRTVQASVLCKGTCIVPSITNVPVGMGLVENVDGIL